MRLGGILLAAGAGSRMGIPKALVVGKDGEPWLRRGIRVLRDAGCNPTIVILGARADDARALLTTDPAVIVGVAERWRSGLSASLRRGLEIAGTVDELDAVAITLVDLPDLSPETIRRVASGPTGRGVLRQAQFEGRPGHPVLIGHDHWKPVCRQLSGDVGARPYLVAHGVQMVDCSDLGTGRDVDSFAE